VQSRILIIGHSHAVSVLNGSRKAGFLTDGIIGGGYPEIIWKLDQFNNRKGKSLLPKIQLKKNESKNVFDLISNFTIPEKIVICWNGNQHNARSLLNSNVEFDFLMDGHDVNLSKFLIPKSIIEDFLDYGFIPGGISNWLRELLNTLNFERNKEIKIVLLNSPPPLPTSICIERLSSDSFFSKNYGYNTDVKFEVTDFLIRRKLWFAWTLRLKFWANEFGILHVEQPKPFFDHDGSLALRYWGEDITHANDDYGRDYFQHVMNQI
jgi:hypothetical protein